MTTTRSKRTHISGRTNNGLVSSFAINDITDADLSLGLKLFVHTGMNFHGDWLSSEGHAHTDTTSCTAGANTILRLGDIADGVTMLHNVLN